MRPAWSVLFFLLIIAAIGAAAFLYDEQNQPEPIRVGILHSLSGTMAISETGVVEATLMAIEELNAQGGVMGRPIEPIVVDIRSDWEFAAQEAERLIVEEEVAVIFGCWTSACRKTVKPVFEQYNHLLIYPVQYEGLEQSPNILYTGAAPNQQLIPAVKWALDNLGDRFFLVGSDYVFPHTANAIMRDQILSLNGQIVGEDYILLGSTEVESIVAAIQAAQPDVILNTINGDSNIAFFQALRQAGITPQDTPTISFSIAEPELQTFDLSTMTGDYAVWNYFQSVDRPENRAFVRRFQDRMPVYGGEYAVLSDPQEAAYVGVRLWAQAVEQAQTSAVEVLRTAILDQSFDAPQGIIYVDPETRHTWKTVRVGQIEATGQFRIVWSSESPIRPNPFPVYRSSFQWARFLDNLYTVWGNNWANPG
jgi:urea transport system substrate-binding protein